MNKKQDFTVRNLNERIREAKQQFPGDIDAQVDHVRASLSKVEVEGALLSLLRMAVTRVGLSDRTRIEETFPSKDIFLDPIERVERPKYGPSEVVPAQYITESEMDHRLQELDDGREKLSFMERIHVRSGADSRIVAKVSTLRKNLRRHGTTNPSKTMKEEYRKVLEGASDRAIREIAKVVKLANIAEMLDREVCVRGTWKMLTDCELREVEWLAEQAGRLVEGALGEAAFYTALADNMRKTGASVVSDLKEMEKAA